MRPNLSEAFGASRQSVEDTVKLLSKQLTSMGVRHAIAGGVAVGSYGYPRATVDVDVVIGEESYVISPSGLYSLKYTLPYQGVGNVRIDYISIKGAEGILTEAVANAKVDQGIPVVPIEALVVMKLVANRYKDRSDVVEMVKGGIPVVRVRMYITEKAPHLLEKFESLVSQAKSEV